MRKIYVNLFTRIPLDLRDRLDKYLKESDESITQIVEEALEKTLDDKEGRAHDKAHL